MGSQVIVVEIDPIRALEALMEGYQVMPIARASSIGDIFITATGDINVIDSSHVDTLKDGAILANSGHFNVEINIAELEKKAKGKREVRPSVTEYSMPDGRRLFLLGEGRLINLAAAEGHPASVMDMSFANQALSVEHLWNSKGKLKPNVYPVPEAIDKEVGRLKLVAMGIEIDKLTPEQKHYLESWESGT